MSVPDASQKNSARIILEQIHRAEQDSVQRIQAAEKQAEALIHAAQQKASNLKPAVNDLASNTQTGTYREVIEGARQDSHVMIDRANQDAASLNQMSDDRVRAVTDWALGVLLGEYGGGDV